MASGADALVLQECTLDEFGDAARRWIEELDLHLLDDGIAFDGTVALYTVQIQGKRFWLAADRFLDELALEPQEADSTFIVRDLFGRLSARAPVT